MHKTIETTDTPELVVKADGDLKIEAHDDLVVECECDDDRAEITSDGNRIIISSHSDCELTVPRFTAITIRAVGGDCGVEEVTGPMTIGPVGGDLEVRECGVVEAHSVGGDCKFEDCDGPVSVRSVGGDLSASDTAFSGSHLNVGGDASIQLIATEGDAFTVSAGGDISLEFAEGANATVEINDSEGSRRVKLGDGAVHVRANAGGDVALSHEGEEEDVISETVTNSVNEAMRQVERELNDVQRNIEQMAREFGERFAGMGVPQWQMDRARHKAEAASRKVEAKLRRRMAELERRAQRDVERAAQRAARAGARAGERAAARARRGANWSWSWSAGAPPKPPAPPAPPRPPVPPMPPNTPGFANAPFEAPAPPRRVTEEERLLILRMLQDKKITSEQAEQLLAALDA